MTNIKARGFETAAQLDEHLAELEEEPASSDSISEPDYSSAVREIAWLRKEVADLRERLLLFRGQNDDVVQDSSEEYPWLRIAATVAATFVLGRLVQHLRLGAGGVRHLNAWAEPIRRYDAFGFKGRRAR